MAFKSSFICSETKDGEGWRLIWKLIHWEGGIRTKGIFANLPHMRILRRAFHLPVNLKWLHE